MVVRVSSTLVRLDVNQFSPPKREAAPYGDPGGLHRHLIQKGPVSAQQVDHPEGIGLPIQDAVTLRDRMARHPQRAWRAATDDRQTAFQRAPPEFVPF